jgi:hypothetical protein
MRQSHTPEPASKRRRPPRHTSATTAAGMAAERVVLAERDRRLSQARTAARQLEERPAATGSRARV